MKLRPITHLAFPLAAAIAALLASPSAFSASIYWDGTTASWNTAANWSTASGAVTPNPSAVPGSADDAIFNITTANIAETITLDANQAAKSLAFNNTGTTAITANSSGTTNRTLTINTGGITIATGAGAVTLGNGGTNGSVLISLATGQQTWTNNSANNFTINNTASTFTRSAGATLVFDQASTGLFSMSTTVLPNSNNIVGPWAFFGTGTNMRYAVNNSGTIAAYSGGTSATDANGFATATTNYDFSTTGTTTLTGNRTANTIRYTGTGNSIDLGASGSNTLTLNGILAVGSSGTLTIQRTGGTGTLTAGSTNELVIAGTQSVTISAPFSGTNKALTYNSPGTLTLSAANTHTGSTSVGGGSALVLMNQNALQSSVLNVNNSSIVFDSSVSGNAFTFGGLASSYAGPGFNIALQNNAAIPAAIALTVSSSSNSTYNGVLSGPGSLIKSGGSQLTLAGANTYSGGTTVNAGTLAFGSNTALGTGTVTVNGGTLANSAAGLNLANSLTLNGGTLNISYNGTTPQWSGPVTLTANSTISAQSSGGGGIVSGNIGESGGSFGFTKTGNDRLAIIGTSNTYNGPTTVSTGVLTFRYSLYGNDTLKWIPANISVASGATLALNIGGAGEFTASQAGTLFSQLATSVNNNGLRAGSIMGFDLNNAGTTVVQTVSATLTDSAGTGGGAVGLSILGTGNILELTGANTFIGPVITDRNNTLKVSSLNSVATNVGLGTVHSVSSNLGAPTTVANGTITLGNQTTYAGGTLLYTGTGETTDRVIKLGGANGQTFTLDQSGSGLLKFVSDMTHGDTRGLKTFQLQGSTAGTGEFAGVIINPGTGTNILALTKSGTGTWTISGANTYTGGTNINGGTLRLSGANNMPGTGTVTISTGGNFSLADGTARATTGATTGVGLNLATGSTMGFDWNAGSLDSFTTTGTATSTGNVGIIINNTSPSGGGGTLITAASGSTLNTANYFLANNTNFTATLSKTATTVSIGAQTVASSLTNAYWKRNQVTGALDTMAYSLGTLSNWASDATGTVAGGVVPNGSAVNVIFGTTGSVPGSPTTGADMNLGSITFNDTAAVTLAGSNAITLNSTSTTAASTTAALAAVTAGSAISVTSFANATNTISAKIVLGANQTWNVANTKTLAVSGVVSGTSNLTKADAGTVTLSGANIYTGATSVTGGTLKAGVASVAGVSGAFGNDSAITLANTAGVTMDITGFNTRIGSITGGGTTGGNVTLGAATLTVGGNNTSPAAYAGIISGTNGVLAKIGAGTQILSGANSYTGATTISGGKLQLGAGGTTGALTGTTSITNNANLTVNRSNPFTQATDLNSKVISGTGSFTQAGSGTTTLSLTNTYTGATNVTDGKLVVNGTISTSTLTTVSSGATLGGDGTVGALTVSSGGFVTPGNSPGILTVNGNYIQAGTYTAEITGTTPGIGGHDQISVTGTVNITGGSLATVFSGTGYSASNLLFILLNDGTDAITGTYAGFAQGAVVATYGGLDWEISYNADSTANTFTGTPNGNDIALRAIPEPGAALLGGLGLLALLRRRRH